MTETFPGVDVTQLLITQGGFAVAFALIFFFYRKDVKQFTDLWKSQTEALITVVKENTASNTRLIASTDSQQVLLAQVMAFIAALKDGMQSQSRRATDTLPPNPREPVR